MRLVAAAIVACLLPLMPADAQEQRAIASGSLPPIERDYKARISAWGRGFFAEPRLVGGATISDPVLVRDTTGKLVWLVCLQATNTAPGALPPGTRTYAFGFAPNYMSAPLMRRGATLTGDDCADRPLAWRAFPGLMRS